MPAPQSDLLQGTLDVLILKSLAPPRAAWHGHFAQDFADDQWDF